MSSPSTTEPATLGRSQTKDAESIVNTRQDRGIFITGGGTWTWDASTNNLSWTDEITIYVQSVGTHTIPAGAVGGLDVAGKTARIIVDRSGPSATFMITDDIANSIFNADDIIPIALRGLDDRLYVRDGTIFNHGESKLIGTSEQGTDRVDTLSDGRLNPHPYPIGRENGGAADGIVLIGDRTNFNSPTAAFNTWIPNTLGEPDSMSFLHIQGDGVFQITQVIDNFNVTINTLATVGTGLVYEVYDQGFGYINGSGQLLVHVNGIVKIAGIDYDEPGLAGDTVHMVSFKAGKEPGVGANVEFINVSGGQGPQGDAGVVDFQDAYDAGPDISGSPAKGPIELDWPGGPDVVLQTKVGGGPTPFTILHADGTLEIRELLIDDGAGNQWSFKGFAPGNLRLEHMGSGKGFEFSPGGGLSFYDTAGAPLGSMRWAEYSGTFGTPAVAVTIATGIVGIKGVIVKVEDAGAGKFYVAELNRASTTTAKAVVAVDPAGNVFIDGDFAGGNLGSVFDGGDYHVIVFYG